MALHAAQAVPEIAVSRVRKSQEEVTGKRTREGEEEGGGGIQKVEIRRKKKEFRRQKAACLVCWCLRPASMLNVFAVFDISGKYGKIRTIQYNVIQIC